jgi:phospholipase C
VSWIIAPTKFSEHATHHPSAGEAFTDKLLQVLQKHPETYATTAFILDYDEGGQFYDHAWAPTPPMPGFGVSTAGVEGEVNPDVMTDFDAPVGMGFRVPMLIVSPWTRGNIVVSEVFDHTSVIQLVEERFGVTCPVLSDWRRTAAGNLLSAFDFEKPDYSWPELPDTSHYYAQSIAQCRTLPPPEVPAEQTFPQQESGTRASRALPYQFSATDTSLGVSPGGDAVEMGFELTNTGSGGAPFMLLDTLNLDTRAPRQYTVGAGQSITETLTLPISDADLTSAKYQVTLVGPNGFVRELGGDALDQACVGATASLTYDVAGGAVVVDVANNAAGEVSVLVTDNAYNTGGPYEEAVSSGAAYSKSVPTASSGNWYDLTVAVSSGGTSCLTRRYMGRMETGADTVSDPAMAAGVPGLLGDRTPKEHPRVPEKHRTVRRNFLHTSAGKDSVFYDDEL